MAPNFKRRPRRADVARALREVSQLWRPPDDPEPTREDAPVAAEASGADQESEQHFNHTPPALKRYEAKRRRPRSIAEAEKQLRFANSYNRADAVVDCFLVMHPRRFALLGEEWSGCDFFPPIMRTLIDALPCPTLDAMTPDEQSYLTALPDIVEVWRGCYQHNRNGFSWTIDRETAKKFTTLMRYHHPDLSPLLLQGRVRRSNIVFVKLGRNEFEIVPRPGAVEIVAEEYLRKAA